MTLIVHNINPQFMAKMNAIVVTEKGRHSIYKEDDISLSKSEDGRLFIGNEPGDVLEIVHKTALRDLLYMCIPATFEEHVDEEGAPFIQPIPVLTTVSIDDVLARIPLIYKTPTSTLNVVKIIN